MFSAVYLVCVLGQPCMFFVDTSPYESLEACHEGAADIIEKNRQNYLNGLTPEHTAEHQCVAWDKA